MDNNTVGTLKEGKFEGGEWFIYSGDNLNGYCCKKIRHFTSKWLQKVSTCLQPDSN